METSGLDYLKSLAQEVIRKKLRKAKWILVLYYQGDLVWSNDERKVWPILLKNSKFTTKIKWKEDEPSFSLTIKSKKQECLIDEIQLYAMQGMDILYSKIQKIPKLHMKIGDVLNIDLDVRIN